MAFLAVDAGPHRRTVIDCANRGAGPALTVIENSDSVLPLESTASGLGDSTRG